MDINIEKGVLNEILQITKEYLIYEEMHYCDYITDDEFNDIKLKYSDYCSMFFKKLIK